MASASETRGTCDLLEGNEMECFALSNHSCLKCRNAIKSLSAIILWLHEQSRIEQI